MPLEPGEQLYGLGMNLKVFQLMGGKKTIRVSDDQGTVLGDSHAPVPFYVSTRGYGVYVDTARYASFYFGNLDAVRDAPGRVKTGDRREGCHQYRGTVPPARTWERSSWAWTFPRQEAWTCTSLPVPTCDMPYSGTICFPGAAAFRRCGAWACGIVPRPSLGRRKS